MQRQTKANANLAIKAAGSKIEEPLAAGAKLDVGFVEGGAARPKEAWLDNVKGPWDLHLRIKLCLGDVKVDGVRYVCHVSKVPFSVQDG